MPTAGEFCNRRTIVAKQTENVSEAARRMHDEHVGCLVVVDDQPGVGVVPVGMITDRDLTLRVLTAPERYGRPPPIGDVMTKEVVSAWEDEDLADVLKQMRSFGIRRIPVVDRSGALQGIIALDDIANFLQEQLSDVSTLFSRESTREEGGASLPEPIDLAGPATSAHYEIRPWAGGWGLFTDGERTAAEPFRTQSEALVHAKDLARSGGGAHISVWDEHGAQRSEFFYEPEQRAALRDEGDLPTSAASGPARARGAPRPRPR